MAGDFSMLVSHYVKALASADVGLGEIRAVARTLGLDVLVPDDSDDPYAMLLVRASGIVEPAGLDPEALDVREENRLSADAPRDPGPS